MSELNAESFNVNDVSLDEKALANGKSQFCEIWPTVKQGLEILKGIVKNPFLKTAISGLILVGDGIC